MILKIRLLFILLCLFPNAAMAQDNQRIMELENKVKDLSVRLENLEKIYKQVNKGGFSVVPVVNCELITPFDGSYASSELSKAAATYILLERCKEKAKNKAECNPARVVCR